MYQSDRLRKTHGILIRVIRNGKFKILLLGILLYLTERKLGIHFIKF